MFIVSDVEWNSLKQQVLNYKKSAYAESTKGSYCTMRDSFLRFCVYFHLNPVPASSDTICNYVVFLSRSLSVSSIPCYMNVVRLMHIEQGFENPLKGYDYSIVVKGINRQLGRPPKQKLPITVDILVRIKCVLDMNSSRNKAFWSACILGFLGFFRKSTLLPKTCKNVNKSLLIRDVHIAESGDFVSIAVRQQKLFNLDKEYLSYLFIGQIMLIYVQ